MLKKIIFILKNNIVFVNFVSEENVIGSEGLKFKTKRKNGEICTQPYNSSGVWGQPKDHVEDDQL